MILEVVTFREFYRATLEGKELRFKIDGFGDNFFRIENTESFGLVLGAEGSFLDSDSPIFRVPVKSDTDGYRKLENAIRILANYYGEEYDEELYVVA